MSSLDFIQSKLNLMNLQKKRLKFLNLNLRLTGRYIALDNLGPSVHDPIKTIRRATISLFEYKKRAGNDFLQPSHPYEELLRGFYEGFPNFLI
jgi:hypothetical protein